MILLLGASGYIGSAFTRELQRRGKTFKPLARTEVDYANFTQLVAALRELKPSLVINAAGFSGRPNVDACELAKAETLQGNTLLPLTIAQACATVGVPWGHVSSGCIYTGAWVTENGQTRLEPDLTRPEVRELAERNPAALQGFKESDEPNFSFRRPPCSFYSGTKALAEEAVTALGNCYVWRLRIPFDEFDSSRNFLSKLQRYPKVYDNINSISHRTDFVQASLDLWERRAPLGVYNITNPGFTTARQVVELIKRHLHPTRDFSFWENDEEFYRVAVKTPRSNCVMDTSKLAGAGVRLRSAAEAVEDSLKNWKPESK